MIKWQTLLNSLKLPLFPYNMNLFHFASGLLSYACANFFFLIPSCGALFSSSHVYRSKPPKILVTGILWQSKGGYLPKIFFSIYIPTKKKKNKHPFKGSTILYFTYVFFFMP